MQQALFRNTLHARKVIKIIIPSIGILYITCFIKETFPTLDAKIDSFKTSYVWFQITPPAARRALFVCLLF